MKTELEQQLTNALAAHSKWKLKLNTAIRVGRHEQSVADVRRCDLCEFGKWIENEANFDAKTKQGRPLRVTRRLHKEFHEAAAAVLDHAINGREDEALKIMNSAYAERAGRLTKALSLWRSEVRR